MKARVPGVVSSAGDCVPFMNRMGLVFLISLGLAVAISLAFRGRGDANRVTMEGVSFRTPTLPLGPASS